MRWVWKLERLALASAETDKDVCPFVTVWLRRMMQMLEASVSGSMVVPHRSGSERSSRGVRLGREPGVGARSLAIPVDDESPHLSLADVEQGRSLGLRLTELESARVAARMMRKSTSTRTLARGLARASPECGD